MNLLLRLSAAKVSGSSTPLVNSGNGLLAPGIGGSGLCGKGLSTPGNGFSVGSGLFVSGPPSELDPTLELLLEAELCGRLIRESDECEPKL